MDFIQAYAESDDDEQIDIETDKHRGYLEDILACHNDDKGDEEDHVQEDDQLDNDDLMLQKALHLLNSNKCYNGSGDHCDEDFEFFTGATTETDEDSHFETDGGVVTEAGIEMIGTEMDGSSNDTSTELTNVKTKMVIVNVIAKKETDRDVETTMADDTTAAKTAGTDDDFLSLPPGDQEEGLYDMATLIDDVALERERLYAICPIKFKDEDDKSRRCKPFPYTASKGVLSELKDHGYNTWVSQSVKTSVSTLIEQTGQFIVYCQGQLKNKDKTR